MDDPLQDFGQSPGTSTPKKRKIDNPVDPGIVDVELKCDRWSVEAKWPFGTNLMKADLLAVKWTDTQEALFEMSLRRSGQTTVRPRI